MIILKSNTGQLFYTDELTRVDYLPTKLVNEILNRKSTKPLHHCHEMTDKQFLLRFFKKEHDIFDNFSNSYYYILWDEKNELCSDDRFVERPRKKWGKPKLIILSNKAQPEDYYE